MIHVSEPKKKKDEKTKDKRKQLGQCFKLSGKELKTICLNAGINPGMASRGFKSSNGYAYILTPLGLMLFNSIENSSFSYNNFQVLSEENLAQNILMIGSNTGGCFQFLFIEHYGSEQTDDVTAIHLYDPETGEDYWIRETEAKNTDEEDDKAKPDYNFSFNLYYKESAEIRKFLESKARFLGFFKHSGRAIQPVVDADISDALEPVKTKFLRLSLKQYLLFLPLLLLTLGVFIWLAREYLFFDYYLNALSEEAKAIEKYVARRTSNYYYDYEKALKYSKFWEWLLSVHDREKYMASKGYEFRGNWGLSFLPPLDDEKGMYSSSYACVGRRIADGRYTIFYDYPSNTLSFNYSAYGVNVEYLVKLDNYQRKQVKDGTWMDDANFEFEDERYYPWFWTNAMYYGLATEYRDNQLVASGLFFILEKATKESNLSGFFSGSQIFLAMTPENLASAMGEDIKEDLIKNRANPLDAYKFEEEVKKKIRQILMSTEAANVLIHEGGHAIQYSLRFYEAWEYIARYLEGRQYSISNM